MHGKHSNYYFYYQHTIWYDILYCLFVHIADPFFLFFPTFIILFNFSLVISIIINVVSLWSP